jgi:type IV pilus assembly protein PilB
VDRIKIAINQEREVFISLLIADSITEKIDLGNININSETVKKIPEQIARDNCIIAFNEDKDTLYVAVSNKANMITSEEIRFISGKEIKFYMTEKNKIIDAINNYYCKYSVESAIEDIKIEFSSYLDEKSFTTMENIEEEYLQESSSIKLTNSLINSAINQAASDIHIEPFQDDVLVRFRVDGVINEFITLPKNVYNMVCTRIKITAFMDISEKRKPQDGKISYIFSNKNYDLRVSTLPTVYGEKIVIRILNRSNEMKSLDSLGFYKKDVELIKSMIQKSSGIIIVTGPTGSGKTTTLYSMLNNLNKKEKNITSIEDPVEYTISNINQVNVNTKSGVTFAEGLRSILRQDPDVMMIGEIRDEETAQIAIRAAITGHLVITTLHTNDAAESILRLEDMGIPRYFIQDALISIIAQRLVRKICPHCIEAYSPLEYEKSHMDLRVHDKLYKGKGCSRCNNTGYKGRTVIYEIMDAVKLKEGIKNKNSTEEIRKYNLNNGMTSIVYNCAQLVKKGITTYEELLKINI